MTSTAERQHDEPSRPFAPADASRLLLVGVTSKRHPVDDVVERLAARDGPRWFEIAITTVTGIERAGWEETASIGAEAFTAAKERAKTAMAEAAGGGESAAATAAYFAAVAGAMGGHGERITNRPPNELIEPMQVLASLAPEPWAAVFAEAARRFTRLATT